MSGKAWSDRELGLLKRAMRLYEGQCSLVAVCEPELSERGYDALRVKSQRIPEGVEEVEGLRFDYAPQAVYDQCVGLCASKASRTHTPSRLKADHAERKIEDGLEVSDVPGGKEVRYIGRHLRTEQDIRNEAGLSRERWECVKFEYSDHQVAVKGADDEPDTVYTLPRAFARFKPREGYDELEAFRAEILQEMEAHAPDYPEYPKPDVGDDPHMLEFSPFDLHIGKLAWKPETGENYDSALARDLLIAATDDVLGKVSGFPIHQVLLPLGNDLFHYDTLEQTTTAGTRMDADSRPDLMHERAERLLVDVVDRLAALAPVTIVTVPGNHDRQAAQWIGRVLRAWYRNTDRVDVDCSPNLRKYHRWGPALLGFTHGSEEKHRDLPLIMAREAATDWAECEQYEFHIGHFHKKKQTVYTAGDSFNGVRVRTLPSLSGTDAWHHSMGYIKTWRAVESYLWSQKTGYVGHFSSNVIDGEMAKGIPRTT